MKWMPDSNTCLTQQENFCYKLSGKDSRSSGVAEVYLFKTKFVQNYIKF